MVYMHLDRKWLDSRNRKIRKSIKERLTYLASKKGWFVPAGTILDRTRAIYDVKLYHSDGALKIVNTGARRIEEFTVISHKGRSLREGDTLYKPQGEGEILLGAIRPQETLSLKII